MNVHLLRWPMEKTDKRCAIVRATLELVAEHGFHGAPMALVAERAGVAAGTIYRYFESKDVLIKEVHHYMEERFYTAMMEGYPERGHWFGYWYGHDMFTPPFKGADGT